MARRIMVEIVGSDKLSPVLKKTERSAEGFSVAMSGVVRSAGGFSRGFLSGAGALSSFGGALALTSGAFFAGAGIVAGLKAAVGAAGDFQRTLNVLQQVSGATSGQLQSASREARRLGGDLSLPATSASDAAQAMLELSKGGLSLADAMRAARGTLQLAAAAQTDVGTAADTTARALTAFRLSGKSAGEVADALANAANAATGNIADFAIGLSQSATSAHAFGLSAVETVAALTELAKAGLVGSDAGTSLRVMLSRLLPTSVAARKEMARLGVTVKDAHGGFLPFRDVVDQYQQALSKLPRTQQQAALQTIFGTDAQRAANIILREGVKSFDAYTTAVGKQGGAARAAAAQNKGFLGALDAFQSALQTTEVSLGQTLLPTLTTYLRQSAKWLGDTENQAKLQKEMAQAVRFTIGAVKDAVSVVKAITGPLGGVKRALELLIALKVGTVLFRWAGDFRKFSGAVKALNEASIINSYRNLDNLSKSERRVLTAAQQTNPQLVTMLGNLRKLARNWTLALSFKFPKITGPLAAVLGLSTKAKFGAAAVAVTVANLPNAAGGPSSIPQTESAKSLLKLIERGVVPKSAVLEAAQAAGVKAGETVGQALNDERFRQALTQRLKQEGIIGGLDIPNSTLRLPNPGRGIPPLTVGGLGPGSVGARKGLTASQKNTFFDNEVARILLRGGIGTIQQQIGALQRANTLIAARLKVTKDVTRRLNLEDQLLQNAAQVRDLQQQAAAAALQKRQDAMAEFIGGLQLGVTKAVATSRFDDDLRALKRLEDGIRKQIREFGKTADLAGQLFDVQQQIADTTKRQRDARQFFALGLSPTGDDRVPLVKSLKRELTNVSSAVEGTFLDTKKTRSVLANIKKVLSGGIGSISSEVRSKIKEMLDGIDQQLANHARHQTLFSRVNSQAFISALGLNLTPEEKRRISAVLSTVGARGTVPASGSAAFSAAGAQTVVVQHTTILDGKVVERSTTKRQQKNARRQRSPRRGPGAGR